MRYHALLGRPRVASKPLTLSTTTLIVTVATLALLGLVVWFLQLRLLD